MKRQGQREEMEDSERQEGGGWGSEEGIRKAASEY
jgi:hypothetical protein